MRNDVGVFNSQSHTNEYIRDLRNSPPFRQPVRTSVTRSDLDSWAKLIAAKYDVALFHGVGAQIRTLEENLKALAEYADELAEVKAGM